jgi:hypothetical protein
MVRLIEVVNTTQYNPRHERVATPTFMLQELWINEQYVVNLRRASGYTKLLEEGRLPNELDGAHEFTAITTLTGGVQEVYVVVGALSDVARKVSIEKPILLKG